MPKQGAPRAGPLWAWVVGLLVLVLMIWFLVDRAASERGVREADGVPPAEERVGAAEDEMRDIEGISAPVPLNALLPLRAADSGAHVSFDGPVVRRADEGAWIRTDPDAVVFVRVREGTAEAAAADTLIGRGVVRHDVDGRIRGWLEASDLPPRDRADHVADFYVATTPDRLGRAPREER